MANNRLYLVCGEQRILLAKYYPSSGWYCFHSDLAKRLDDFFNSIEDEPLTGMSGILDFRVELEHPEP